MNGQRRFITVVSGLPRSGTSLAMQMLRAGGMPLLCDDVRVPDEDNPAGYFEYEPVKRTATDASWVDRAPGCAVKVVAPLVRHLPPRHEYRVLLMRRNLAQVIASQECMLARRGEAGAGGLPVERLAEVYATQLAEAAEWLAATRGVRALELHYGEIVRDPAGSASAVDQFLGGGLDRLRIAAVVGREPVPTAGLKAAGPSLDAARAIPDRAAMIDVLLKPDRDRSVRRRHPWLLSGAVERVEGEGAPGDWARVLSAGGETLGFGHWSPQSQIRVRLLAFGDAAPGDEVIAQRIAGAVARRTGDPLVGDTDAVRLVNAEGDGLPGLVVDRYADLVVVRLATAGMDARRALVADALREATGAAAAFERPDAPAARREGIAAQQGPLWGDPPKEPIPIRERERRYRVDVVGGQKTGFYLDQRDARDLVQSLAAGRRVLDLFAYTGGFAVAAAHGGAASITAVESSVEALATAEAHLAPWAEQRMLHFAREDAFRLLRHEGGPFDLLIVDPPPLARRSGDVDGAARGYKDLLLWALRRAAPGAHVLAFSCSHHVGPDLFRKIAFGASLDAGRPVQVLRELGAPADHPVSLDHPEGRYLSGLLLRA